MDIGSRIKEQRAILDISQQKLANLIEVSVDTIRSIEINRAKPSIETLSKLSDVFDCSTDYLLGKTDQPRPITWSHPSKEEALKMLYKQLEQYDHPEDREKLLLFIRSVEENMKD